STHPVPLGPRPGFYQFNVHIERNFAVPCTDDRTEDFTMIAVVYELRRTIPGEIVKKFISEFYAPGTGQAAIDGNLIPRRQKENRIQDNAGCFIRSHVHTVSLNPWCTLNVNRHTRKTGNVRISRIEAW